jgi:polyisoprenoid-binding protein YceI
MPILSRRVLAKSAQLLLLCGLVSPLAPGIAHAQTVPVFEVSQAASTVKFFVKASVSVSGTFDKWTAGLTFTSPDASTGVLDIKIQAASVNTGSGMKDRKLKGEDFFDADKNPVISFHSTRITKTGPDTFNVDGNFTIRGVTKPETLTLTVSGAGTGSGVIKGTMAFNRKDYGINGEIPLIHIADRVDVSVDLKVRRVSGPALTASK